MAVIFKKSKLFDKTFKGYKNDKRIVEAFKEFIGAKEKNPEQRFGSKDYKFKSGVLSEYYHAGLTFDVSIIYRTSREGSDYVFRLYGLFSHDESGTGTPPNTNRQRALLTKLDNQEF